MYYTIITFIIQWDDKVEEVTERHQFEKICTTGSLGSLTGLSLRCQENLQKPMSSEVESPNWIRNKESVRSRNMDALLKELPIFLHTLDMSTCQECGQVDPTKLD